jgi:hypothetical protein
MRFIPITRHLVLSLGWLITAAAAPAALAAGPVDRGLVGTWKLEWPGSALYWAVRPDGVYRMHGPGANPRQLGRLDAQGGKFSMASAVWMDSGSYRVNGNSLSITGKLGPGTWKRVWAPGQGATVSGPGSCSLVSADDVAQILGAPASGGPDARAGDNGCLFRSTLSNLDSLTIRVRRNQGQFFQNVRKGATTSAIDVPGVGDQAWAKAGGIDSIDELAILRGDTWVSISASLQPGLTRADLPALTTLARAIDKRMSGFSLPAPGLTDKQRAMIEKLEEKTRRHSGTKKTP